MGRSVLLMIVAGAMLVSACSDPAADKTKAVTGEAAKVASPAAAAQGQKYLITTQNSKVEFVGSKVTGSHNGLFGEFSGQIDYSGTPEQSRVSITMKTDSLSTDTPDLTKHLKTADFFDVAKYPEATFVSTSIKAGGDKGASHTVTGNLTLHGVTKAVTFPATISVTPDVATVDSTFSINRKDFGINYAGQADNLIRDDVVLKLTIRANKAS
ncbi:MAG TPA: YceI family protein [Pyrinomonadaceae bacterium]|jgi:polyisoprenoid-binding protein YceI|nr:YceI family protein [Pyrinomonadaceae bacterium]